jgi:glutathione-specific gamma-glutamylcyclotransferase
VARRREPLALTPELVTRTLQKVQDAGPPPGLVPMTDDDYAAVVSDLLAGAPAGPLSLFAYGSLLWKPACEVIEGKRALVRGWHRAFCFRTPRFRGTPERPGLMMALDRGGQCQGMIFKIAEPIGESLDRLIRREMTVKPAANVPRWLNAHTDEGTVKVIGFVVSRQVERYAGRLPLGDVAEILSTAVGSWGSCAEYLYETVVHLEKLGIHDRNLWQLQRLVAERIAARHAVVGSDVEAGAFIEATDV